jgi:hypothetical protein
MIARRGMGIILVVQPQEKINMKASLYWLLAISLLLLGACSEKVEEQTQELGGWLDSAYVSKGYRAAMDSIHTSSGISDADFKQLQGYMREFRDSLQGHPTYRDLLERSKGLQEMRKGGVTMKMKSMSLHHVQKLIEVRLVMSFTNATLTPLAGFRGEVSWLDSTGSKVSAAPSFSVIGPLLPGDSIEDLRLEYAIYKPTGNELNDPRNQAARDTLQVIEKIAKKRDLSAFGLKVLDIRLGNGLTPGQYWLLDKEKREKLDKVPTPTEVSRTPLMKWVEVQKPLVTQLESHSSDFALMVSPVITKKVEAGNGPRLIEDRTLKVLDFFNIQKRIPRSNMNRGFAGMKLVLTEYIDYWNWPMEIRVYRR